MSPEYLLAWFMIFGAGDREMHNPQAPWLDPHFEAAIRAEPDKQLRLLRQVAADADLPYVSCWMFCDSADATIGYANSLRFAVRGLPDPVWGQAARAGPPPIFAERDRMRKLRLLSTTLP